MCDTFVALPSVTRDGSVVFGKNSDRGVFDVASAISILRDHHEKWHRSVLLDFQTRIQILSKERDGLEKAWIQDALNAPSHRRLELTQDIFRQADQKNP